MSPFSLCDTIRSKRSLLAIGWTLVNFLTLFSFISALLFSILTNNNNYYNYNYNYNYNNYQPNDDQQQSQSQDNNNNNNNNTVVLSVTTRAMAFAILWTIVLSILLGFFGTIIVGFHNPLTGTYVWCCPTKVHTTTPLSIGSFVGALVMFSNLTLVGSVLFGEFQIRDYQRERNQGGEGMDQEWMIQDSALSRSSLAFSIMCMFLTILYAGFAAMVFTYADDLLKENAIDSRQEALKPSEPEDGTGLITSDRFGVRGKTTRMSSEGFISPQTGASGELVP